MKKKLLSGLQLLMKMYNLLFSAQQGPLWTESCKVVALCQPLCHFSLKELRILPDLPMSAHILCYQMRFSL